MPALVEVVKNTNNAVVKSVNKTIKKALIVSTF